MKILVICAALLGVAAAVPSDQSPNGNLAVVDKRQPVLAVSILYACLDGKS